HAQLPVGGLHCKLGPEQALAQPAVSQASFCNRPIKCMAPLNLRRIGGTIDEAFDRLRSLDGRLAEVGYAACERTLLDLDSPIEVHLVEMLARAGLDVSAGLFHSCIQLIEDIVQVSRRAWVFGIARKFPVLVQSDIASWYWQDFGAAELR